MSPDKLPGEPLSAMVEAAVSMQELFLSFVQAGFTEAQALHMVTACVLDALRQGREDGGQV